MPSCIAWLAVAASAPAAEHYIRAGATGSGTDWTDACPDFTGPCAPSTMVRGDTYYVAAGVYGGRTFDRAASGTAAIAIRKATSTDHGTQTGWQAAYGDGQARFSGTMLIASSFWIVDGATGSGADGAGYGFAAEDGAACFVIGSGVGATCSDITVAHVYARATAQDVEKVFLQTSPQTGQIDRIAVRHCLLDGWQNGVMARGNPGTVDHDWVFDHNLCLDGSSSAANHGEWINPNSAGFDGLVVSGNVFRGSSGGAGQTGVIVANNSDNDNALIYGNVFDDNLVGNGIITGTSSGRLNGARVYDNTFLNMPAASGDAVGGSGQGSGNLAYDNLFFNMRASAGAGFTLDHDAYFSTTGAPAEADAQVAVGDPLVDSLAGDYRLVAATRPGAVLPQPFDVDPDGRVRGADGAWDRGAYEFVADATTGGQTGTTTSGDSSGGASTSGGSAGANHRGCGRGAGLSLSAAAALLAVAGRLRRERR